MSDEWIITQTGAVKKSEINMILPQPNEKSKIDIVLVTKDKLSLLIYNDVENAYLATVIIDNLITAFDPNHVPQIDLKKKQEEMQEQSEEEIVEEEEEVVEEQPVIQPVTQAVKPPVKKAQAPVKKVEVPTPAPEPTPAPAPAPKATTKSTSKATPKATPAPSPVQNEDEAE